jgi:hypothetical protein
MGLTAIVTNAGRAALVNAANTGTRAVTIAQVGLSGTALAPEAGTTVLPGQFKTIATLSGDVVADDTIHLIVRDESADVFTVRSLALYLADGTLFALYGQADVLLEKSAQALMLLAIDIRFEDVDASAITFGDTNFLNPPATTERQGVVELATVAEAQAGIDALRALTPQAARSAILGWLLAQDGAGCGLDADLLDGQQGSWYTNIAARLGYVPWGPTNDGAGSGLDADLLDGLDSSYFVNIPARLGFYPVQMGTGIGQNTGNVVKVGWSGTRLKATVDTTDQGNLVTDAWLGNGYLQVNASSLNRGGLAVWGPDNDGAGSGLDADLLDGRQASDFALLSGARFQGNGNGVAGSEDWIIFSLRNNQGSASAVGNTSWESVNENGITVTSIQSFLDPDGKSTIALVTPRRAAARRIGARTRPISGGPAAPRTFTAAGCSSTAIPSGGRTTTVRAPGSMPICSMGSRAAGTRTSSGDWAMPRCNRERVSASGPMPSRWAGTAASCS